MAEANLGKRGPRSSRVGLGFWQAGSRLWGSRGMSQAEVEAIISAASSEGLNLFDTAEIYGGGRSEELLGAALRRLGLASDSIVISKVAGYRVSESDIVRAAREIKARLGFTPTILLHHWPPPRWTDPCISLRGLERAVMEGLAEHYGLSNYGENHLDRILECAKRLEPVLDQVQYSLAYRTPELGVKPRLDRHGMALVAWSPLAKGALAGLREPRARAQRMDPVFREAARDKALQAALARVAGRRGVGKAQVALAWLVAKGAFPIPGTMKPSRAREYAQAAKLELSEEEIRMLDEASARYLKKWGNRYQTEFMKLTGITPSIIQRLFISLMGGI